MDGDAAHLGTHHFAFSGVKAGTNFEPERLDRIHDGAGALHGARRPVEGGEEAVAGGIDLARGDVAPCFTDRCRKRISQNANFKTRGRPRKAYRGVSLPNSSQAVGTRQLPDRSRSAARSNQKRGEANECNPQDLGRAPQRVLKAHSRIRSRTSLLIRGRPRADGSRTTQAVQCLGVRSVESCTRT